MSPLGVLRRPGDLAIACATHSASASFASSLGWSCPRPPSEIHRREPLCNSCHSRMDPLGLALEEYNGIGLWRDEEEGKPIETAGKLMTGEKFADVRELSKVIAEKRTRDFYRCVTEKLLTYALGRGVEYYDAPAIDQIVHDLEADGRMRTLIYGIVDSAPFQLRRRDAR